jgi:hypothetical protein
LIFEKEFEYKLENNSYCDVIQLKNLEQKAQALQFRLLVNQAEGDSTFMIFQSIEKGSDVSDSSWALSFNIFRGDTNSIGAGKDVIFILLYNLNQNGGLDPGNYNELFKVNYRIADLPALENTVKSSFRISNTEATTNQGFPIDITPSRDTYTILINDGALVPKFGLVFEKDTVYQLEDASYNEKMQLLELPYKTQALQFRLLSNQALDDNVILTFQSIEKGDDISDPSWILSYSVFRGNLTGNGASVDEIYILIYNLNQDGGLEAGEYGDILNVMYRVADLPALQDSIKSSFLISHAEATTFQGFPVDITPSREELTIIARNRIGFYGDVNGDGCLDILDIIMVVDHIVGRDSLGKEEFERADIAPWVPGNELPDPDGYVNVQDLSLLQNIILTGIYPNGTPINACSFVSPIRKIGEATPTVKLYFNNERITIYINSEIDIRAVQLEVNGVNEVPDNMIINTDLGKGYYLNKDDCLRVLMYDRRGDKVVKSGNNFVADIPIKALNVMDLTIQNLILIDVNRQRILDSEIEISFDFPPSLPLDYNLYQNYPNPFNAQTNIEFTIPEAAHLTLSIYNLLGEKIYELIKSSLVAGRYKYQWNASNVPTGFYIYELRTDKFLSTKKMLLLK